jgi:hypothetical protein
VYEIRFRRLLDSRLGVYLYDTEEGACVAQTELTAHESVSHELYNIGWLPLDIELEPVNAASS